MGLCRSIVLGAVVLEGLVAIPATGAVAENLTRSIEIGQTRRSYVLYLPDSPAVLGHGLPLVVALHGGGSTAEQMVRFSRFNEIGRRERAVIAYPQGLGRSWNDGRIFRGRSESGADDVAFIRALVADIVARGTLVDRSRIYAAGISNGGFMSYRLACEAADLFAAVAPVAATMPADLGPHCRPSAPVAILAVNGTADPLVPFDGGHVRTLFGTRGAIWSTERTIAFWAQHDRCAAPPNVRALADRDRSDGSRVVEIAYARCAGAGVRLLRVEGGGHTWPGGPQYLPVSWIGPTNRDIDATETIWRFFKETKR